MTIMETQFEADPNATSVTSAEFVRKFGRWQDRAATRPVFVTHHGRRRLVMLSVDSYRALTGGEQIVRPDGAAEAKLATLADSVTQGFLAFDGELRFVSVNPVAAAYLRTTRAAMIGQPIPEHLSDLAKSLVHGALLRAIRAGESGSFDVPSLAYPGQWLHFQTFPYGEGAACLFRNITDEVEARRGADARAALLSAIEAHGGIGHARLTARGTFAAVDATLAEMAGFAPESLAHVRMTDILPLALRVAAGGQIEAVLSGGGPRAFDSALMVNKGGERRVRIALAELRGGHPGEGATMVVTATGD